MSRDGDNIYLADSPGDFAERCLQLLENAAERERLVARGLGSGGVQILLGCCGAGHGTVIV